ncbi:LCP family protein [Brevibacterium pityocampae]|uniref:LCP family protein n=1 Tax=Brevibacterium pityocampae TaxID=506594 RepID=A0ABP8J7U7_9MICO
MAQNDTGSPDQRPDGDPSTPASFRASKRPRLRGDSQATGHPSTNGSSTPEARRRSPPRESFDSRGSRETSATPKRGAEPFEPPPVPARDHVNSPRHAAQSKRRRSSSREESDRPSDRAARRPVRVSSASEDSTPLSARLLAAARQKDPSPRRSSRRGDAFPRIVGWTALGTAIPGLGILQARNSRLGWALFIGFFGAILAVVAFVVYRGPLRAVSRIVASPVLLDVTAVLLTVAALIWLIVIFRTYREQRRGEALQRSQKLLGGVLVSSLVLCVGIPLLVGASFARVQSTTVTTVFGNSGAAVVDKDELWADKPRINVFLIGRDTGEGREGTRPDTMLVASIDTRTGATTLISVPRNLALPVFPEGSQLASVFPDGFNAFGYSESMINAVWTWAEEYPEQVGDTGGLEPGMYATMQAVEGSLGLGLDYWASVDMKGFEDVIDAIGGVEIDVERPIPMGGGTSLATGVKNEVFDWIAPGPQTLDGFRALWYVRSREGSDNYDRMCRQQRMLKTTIDQIDPQEIAVAYPRLAGSAGKNIATSIPQEQVNAFIELAVAMQQSEIKSAQINNDVVNTTQPDFDTLHQWVQDQVDPQEPSQAEEDAAEPAPEETETPEETPEPTEEPPPGVEDSAGKCFPKGYEPGDPWPGYPRNPDAPAGTEQGTGAGAGTGAGQ